MLVLSNLTNNKWIPRMICQRCLSTKHLAGVCSPTGGKDVVGIRQKRLMLITGGPSSTKDTPLLPISIKMSLYTEMGVMELFSSAQHPTELYKSPVSAKSYPYLDDF
jgi:hypothetical protein